MAALQELYNAKAADKSKSGKAAFSKWRMTHAHAHYNIQPGPHGKPMFHHDFEDQILDPLHLAELGVPKTPWKYGVLNNCSEDAREEIGALLKHFKHPLDTRRKDDKSTTGAVPRNGSPARHGRASFVVSVAVLAGRWRWPK